MTGGKHLLLLAAVVLLARCQQKPKVSLSPALKQLFTGDVFFLSCDTITSENNVKWYFNEKEQTQRNKTWKIAFASTINSGSYRCESNGQKSDNLSINVLEFVPSASLMIKTGQPVMQTGNSVILQLDSDDDDGLDGWLCWVYREGRTSKIKFKLGEDKTSVTFQPRRLEISETIFWCTRDTKRLRSNQIIVRTSEKKVSLEMYPLPAVHGETLTLRCLAWGTDQISRAVFYKDDNVIQTSASPIHSITHVTDSAKGRYKCDATFTYTGRTKGPPYQVISDFQEVFVQAPPMKAVLSENKGLMCSCQHCPKNSYCFWYHKSDEGQPWSRMPHTKPTMEPKSNGFYACRSVWDNGRTLLSNSVRYTTTFNPVLGILLVIFLVVIMLIVAAVAVYFGWFKKRNTTGPIYEDVALRSQDRGDDKYEPLQKPHGAQSHGEYDTLNVEAERKEGEYQPLNKGEMKEGLYHSVGTQGAVGGEGGYEALKKEGMKEGLYHTVGTQGAVGGEGGYEALKKEGMKEGLYHTVGLGGAGGGGDEAVGKEDKDYEKVEEKM